MTDMSNEEEQLRRQLLKGVVFPDTMPEPPAVDNMITTVVRQANVQTAGRDLLVLAISSFFAVLLVFFAPVIAVSAAKKKGSSSVGTDTNDVQSPEKRA